MSHRWRLYRQAEPPRGPLTAGFLAGLFLGLIMISRSLCSDVVGDTSFFPANAALVVAILVLPPRLGVATSLACLAGNAVLNAIEPDTLYNCVRLPPLNIALCYLTAFLMRSLCGAAIDLSRARRLLIFTGICALSAGLEGGLGAMTDQVDPALKWANWMQWSLCDGLGLLLGTPAILLGLKSREQEVSCDAGPVERWLLLTGTTVLSLLAFRWTHTPLILLLYPALILTAFRAGPAWVLTSVLLVCLVASAMTVHGYGPLVLLSTSGQRMRGFVMQPYLFSLFLAALPANNALGERTRTARRLRRLKTAIEHDATHDALTGLANRMLFRRRLAAAIQARALLAVFFIDADHFKAVNDTLGHQAGDMLLRKFSARLVAAVPANALVARFGGDEFAVVLRRNGASDSIATIAEAMLTSARAPFDLAEGPAHVSASIGVTQIFADTVDEAELMRQADIALYAAKAAGRDCYRMFQGALDEEIQMQVQIEQDLRAALNGAGGLSLHYQLKVSRTGAVRGAEAFLRWSHPRLGLILPRRFIPIAEKTGLILPLGDWVLREAAEFAGRWPHLHVAVNVSPLQIRNPAFLDSTLRTLHKAGVSGDRIELEVTETAFLEDMGAAMQCLTRLRQAGLKIALDDFGSGYSSFRHLQNFKADRLKIDKSFVTSIASHEDAIAIVKAIVNLGHAMNLQVTAEGVETEEQRQVVLDAGIDELQGCLFHRPMDEADLKLHMDAIRQGAYMAIA